MLSNSIVTWRVSSYVLRTQNAPEFQVNERFEEGTGNKATFQQIKTWEFLPEESDGDLDDMVTNIAMVPLVTSRGEIRRSAFALLTLRDSLFRLLPSIHAIGTPSTSTA